MGSVVPARLARTVPSGIALLILGLCAAPASAVYEDVIYDAARYGPEEPLEEILREDSLGLGAMDSIPNARVLIVKGSYQLMLYSGDRLLKTYRIQLGEHPRGAKTRRYDGRTPVGSYRICGRNRWSRYYLSLQLDYPNDGDIARALERKRISRAQAEQLRAALAAGDCPSGRTRLGGEIFIHGQLPRVTREIQRARRKPSARTDLQPGDLDPARLREWYNWTQGCIGMTNPDIRELYKHLPDGTPVEIRE